MCGNKTEEVEAAIEETTHQKLSNLKTTSTNVEAISNEAQVKIRRMIGERKNSVWKENCSKLNTCIGRRQSSKIERFHKKDSISLLTPAKLNQLKQFPMKHR